MGNLRRKTWYGLAVMGFRCGRTRGRGPRRRASADLITTAPHRVDARHDGVDRVDADHDADGHDADDPTPTDLDADVSTPTSRRRP
jgi:hypothetical protein